MTRDAAIIEYFEVLLAVFRSLFHTHSILITEHRTYNLEDLAKVAWILKCVDLTHDVWCKILEEIAHKRLHDFGVAFVRFVPLQEEHRCLLFDFSIRRHNTVAREQIIQNGRNIGSLEEIHI